MVKCLLMGKELNTICVKFRMTATIIRLKRKVNKSQVNLKEHAEL